MSRIPFATAVLSSAASNVTFGSIPASVNGVTIRDLILVVDHPALGVADEVVVRLNDDSGSNYFRTYMEARSGGISTASGTNTTAFIGAYGTAKALLIAQFMDYSITDKHTTIIARGDSFDGTKTTVARWGNTAAVTTIRVSLLSSNLPSGSTISLYGIAG